MPEPIKPCARPWAHLEHETTEGTCPGLANRIRRPSATPCPHPGCGHDAATPDAAHGLPLPLVNVLQELAQHYPPHEVRDAVALLWPDTAPTEAPVMGWRGGACRVRDAESGTAPERRCTCSGAPNADKYPADQHDPTCPLAASRG